VPRPRERGYSVIFGSGRLIEMEPTVAIVWTDYMEYRARLRGFDLAKIEQIVRYSSERYFDTITGRAVAVGRHDEILVVIPL
jgi:hypothetical protein